MRHLLLASALVLTIVLVGCESGELGMKVTVTKQPMPASVPKAVAQKKLGNLTIAIAFGSVEEAQAEVDALVAAFTGVKMPAGELTFTELRVSNRSTQQPPSATGEIDAICIWQQSGEKAACYKVRLSTFSIEIEDWNTQPHQLRDHARKGMARELADTF